jgi:ribosomal protein S27E
MLPLYAVRIEDLGRGDFVKVDCAACHHVALLTPEALMRVGLSPAAKVLDLKGRLRCRGCGKRVRAVVSPEISPTNPAIGRMGSRGRETYL